MLANLENSTVATGLEKVSFHANPKEGQWQRMLKLPYNCSHFTCQLKILQARLQQYMNQELPDVQVGFRKGKGTTDQIANIHLIIGKSKGISEKHLLLLHWLCENLWLCGSQQTVGNSSGDENIRPPYLPPEKSVCRSGSNSQNRTWNNKLVQNWERSTSRLYIVTLLI